MAFLRIGACALPLACAAGMARAELEICNDTGVSRDVAIGYSTGDDAWVSEGWWIVPTGECVTVTEGDLQQRYYYYRAVADAGAIGGEYSFCVAQEVFTIEGDSDCEARGYITADFAEIDTGPTALNYTHRIGAEPEPEAEADDGERRSLPELGGGPGPAIPARSGEGPHIRLGGSRMSAQP